MSYFTDFAEARWRPLYEEHYKDAIQKLCDVPVVPKMKFCHTVINNTLTNESLHFSLETQKDPKKLYALFSIQSLPLSDIWATSYSMWVTYILRGKGLGQLLHDFRLQLARASTLQALLCSVANDNVVQHYILYKFGWCTLINTAQAGPSASLYFYPLRFLPEPLELIKNPHTLLNNSV